MDIVITIAGPSTRAGHAFGVCPGHGLSRENTYADVWSEQLLPGIAAKPISGQRPRPEAVSTLDPQRVSAPQRWSP